MTSDNNIRKRTKKCQLKSGKDTPAPQGQVSVTLDPPQSYLGVARYLHQREPVTKSVLALQSLSDFSKKQKGFSKKQKGFSKEAARKPYCQNREMVWRDKKKAVPGWDGLCKI